MSPDIIATYFIIVLLVIGSFFVLVAGIGLLKLNDPMTRLHAPTKAATLGIGAYLLAAMVNSFLSGGLHLCHGSGFGKFHGQGEYPPARLPAASAGTAGWRYVGHAQCAGRRPRDRRAFAQRLNHGSKGRIHFKLLPWWKPFPASIG